jgi:hypothetical protein
MKKRYINLAWAIALEVLNLMAEGLSNRRFPQIKTSGPDFKMPVKLFKP